MTQMASDGEERRVYRWGMVIDLDKCTGCQACVVACRAENNIPFAGEEQAQMGRAIFWIRIMPVLEGEYPRVRQRFIPVPCQQCDNPPCIKVCPVGATYKNNEGVVSQVYARCIGCRFCTVACPYTVRNFNWYSPQWPEGMDRYLNPDVPVRPRGVVEKCSFCSQRIREARMRAEEENRPVRDGEVVPACVQTCPADAMFFGDLNDPDSTVSRLARSRRAFRLQEELGTNPKVIYLGEEDWDAKA
ncbi:MAG: 4Fe-4S dicluster domain-containing protein [Bacteroidetes bacterium]|nr:4Fe-4S dicluster domain-containing protein [Bacteroidota bacterium]MCL5025514.1 4Fe-4S dicluster domain-containing protein [Chloroflexota bacterium]